MWHILLLLLTGLLLMDRASGEPPDRKLISASESKVLGRLTLSDARSLELIGQQRTLAVIDRANSTHVVDEFAAWVKLQEPPCLNERIIWTCIFSGKGPSEWSGGSLELSDLLLGAGCNKVAIASASGSVIYFEELDLSTNIILNERLAIDYTSPDIGDKTLAQLEEESQWDSERRSGYLNLPYPGGLAGASAFYPASLVALSCVNDRWTISIEGKNTRVTFKEAEVQWQLVEQVAR